MHKQYGFGLIWIIVLVTVLSAVGFAGYLVTRKDNGSDKTQNIAEQSTTQDQEKDIELQNLGLTGFDQLDYTKYATSEYESKGLKGFYVFGDKLEGNRLNPNFEFSSVKKDAPIIAAIDGIIGFIKEQPDTKDFEVFLQPKENSMWTVGYDHLINLQVQKGQTIKAGDIIGYAAPQNNGLARFEIQINKDSNGTTTHLCPSTLLMPAIKDRVLTELDAMQNQWEELSGFNLYDTSNQDPIGCIFTTLSPAQAEGR